jgi:cobalt/nickel transport system ATP-binding protein
MSESVFRLSGVTFAYPGRPPSLQDISFEVRRGERLALLGANGSGKSTLLHLLDGLYFPSAGRVEAFGEPLTEERLERTPFGAKFRAEVGFLFQNSDAQLFCPSVDDELAFGPLQMGLPQGEVLGRVEDIIRLLGLARLRERVPAALSAGEKKRVALASLLTMNPSVLLLDEPTAGLDPRSQSEFLNLLWNLSERGVTLVTATHDLGMLPHLADRALVLGEDHRVAAEGSSRDILADTDLLLRVNLIHAHRHRHGDTVHSHPHGHEQAHDHRHGHGTGNSPPQDHECHK